MFPYIASLFILPLVVSGLLLLLPKTAARFLVIASSVALSILSLYLFLNVDEPFYFGLPHYVNEIVAGADILLLLYFGWVAFRKKACWWV